MAGNALLYLPEPEGYTPMKLYRLNSYVVQRDAFGNVLQIVTLDKIAFNALPEDVRGQVEAAQGEQKEDAEIDVYTHVYLNEAGDGYSKYEEVAEEVVPGSEAEYPLEECPYIPVRMVRIDGESYGRSY
ncbi:portal protein, partial [Klebsiella pneumoniae]|nr:portal protein [Klebsiella pneumoniae]